MDQPKRRYTLTLKLSADSVDDLRQALDRILFDLGSKDFDNEQWLSDINPYSSVSGGSRSSYTMEIAFNGAITHDGYFEQLQVYLDDKKDGR